MTASAESGNIFAGDLAAEARGLTHGVHICSCGIATMTTRTGQTLLRVNVIREPLFRYLQRGIERAMAIQARIWRLALGD